MDNARFDRSIRFFGKEGQARIRATNAAIVGLGGLGSYIAEELALLGVGGIALIDPEQLAVTDRNRHACAAASDSIPGSWKTDICERRIHSIDPEIRIVKVADTLISQAAFDSIIRSNYVFGCLDSDGVRLVLNELCSAYALPYLDLATDIPRGERARYGGRVCFNTGTGCLVCLDQLDLAEAQRELGGEPLKRLREGIYGVERDLLSDVGPSIVSINGVIASLAVTEFALAVSGIRPPMRLITYYAHLGKVCVNNDAPLQDCYYCLGIRGRRDAADVQRYLERGADSSAG
jgi:molybdopterin/thiamine biosynthesis adenylyltransferase